MRKTFVLLAIIFAVGIGVFVYSLVPKNSGAVSLGVIAGTTGDYAAAGEGYLKGFELARAEWNASHALRFTDVVEDDGFNAQKGVTAYQKIKSIDKPDAYAIVSSFTIDAIASDLHKEGKPVALGFEQGIPAQNDNIFQVFPAARPIQKGLGAHLKELGYKKPLLLASNNTPVYSNFAAGFVDGYGAGSVKEEVGADKTAVHSLATKVLSEKPDVIVFYMDPPIGALLAKEVILQSKGTTPQLAFDQSVQSGAPDYKSVFGNTLNLLDGSLVVLSKNDYTEAFKNAFKQKYNADAPFGSDIGYNSFMLLATTYDTNANQWVQNMKNANFTGADGDVSFDNVGLRVPSTYFAVLKNGELVAPK